VVSSSDSPKVTPATKKMVAGVTVDVVVPALAGRAAATAVTGGVTTVAVPTTAAGRTVVVTAAVRATT
jgi:hypothetical protein